MPAHPTRLEKTYSILMNDMQQIPLPEPPDTLVTEFIQQSPRILLLLGAGISRSVVRNNGRCLPSWNELLREMLEWAISRGFSVTPEQQTGFFELCDRGNAQALIRAGGWLRMLLGENFNDFMTETFYFTESISSPIHTLLQKLPLKGVITFNYDNLIELTFGTHLRLVATHLDEDKLAEIQRGSCPLFLLKAHGDVTNFKSIVLGSSDYHKILFQNKTYRKVLSTLFEQNTVLALGFGMEDPDTEYLFDEILTSFPNPPISIYTLVPKGKFDVITKHYWLRERKVQFLEYEQHSEDHKELPQFLSLL